MFKGKNLVALKIKGRSLEPIYMEGDYFIINKNFDCVDGIDVAVQKDGDEITVKKLKIFKNGTIELRPSDANHPTFQEKDSNKIIGVVVGIFKNFLS